MKVRDICNPAKSGQGYFISDTHHSFEVENCCVFAAGVGSFLLYSVHEGIRGIPLDPSDKSDALVPVSGTSLAVGIDFHAGMSSVSNFKCQISFQNDKLTSRAAFLLTDNDTIYWVDMGLSTISRAKRDQTWREDVVTNGIGRVEGIAVDWIAGEAGFDTFVRNNDNLSQPAIPL